MRRIRQDIDHLISAGLLLVTAAAILTGVIAHLWDLNDFSYHIWAGYALTGLAAAHVYLNWQRLVTYARFRLRRRARGRAPQPTPPGRRGPRRTSAATAAPGARARAPGLSRRRLLSVTAGSIAGFYAGRGLRPAPVISSGSDVGQIYHEWSKPGVLDAIGTVADWGRQPPLYKRYAGARRIALPAPDLAEGLRTEQAMLRRRSTRSYAGGPLPLSQLSRLLSLTGGISSNGNRRTAPSSGALYPIEIYPVVHDVERVASGVYHYAVADHGLELVRSGDFRGEVVRQALSQEFLGDVAVVLLFTVIFQRMRFKYRDRTYRYGLIEVGHLGQNAYLAATSMGLGACAVGAFGDDAINDMLGVDGREEAAVYLLGVGPV